MNIANNLFSFPFYEKLLVICFLMLILHTKEAVIVSSFFWKSIWHGSYSILMCNCKITEMGRQRYYFWLQEAWYFTHFRLICWYCIVQDV